MSSILATPTATLSVTISQSPPHTGNGGGGGDGTSIDSLSIGVGVACALLVLTISLVVIIAVLMCLRKRRNKLNTTKNVAYLYSSKNQENNRANDLQDGSCLYMLASPDFNTTQNDVHNGRTSYCEVTETYIHTLINQAYPEAGNNGPTSNTDIIAATNPAYFEVSNIPQISPHPPTRPTLMMVSTLK